jgi:hypothetical protein
MTTRRSALTRTRHTFAQSGCSAVCRVVVGRPATCPAQSPRRRGSERQGSRGRDDCTSMPQSETRRPHHRRCESSPPAVGVAGVACAYVQRWPDPRPGLARPIAHERRVRAGEPRPQRRSVIEVDAHDLDLGIPEGGPGRLRVAGKDPHLLAVTHKRLSQGLTDKSGPVGNSNHVESCFVSECRNDSRRPQTPGPDS